MLSSRFYLTLFFTYFLTSYAYSGTFSLKTSAFPNQGTIPVIYTCDGKDQSPQLSWSNPPDKTQSFTLIVSDPDAPNGTFYHWVVYNIPSDVNELAQNIEQLPNGATAGNNSWDKAVYKGPCPPKGALHRYEFTLYALDSTLEIPADANVSVVLDGLKGHILEQTQIIGKFGH